MWIIIFNNKKVNTIEPSASNQDLPKRREVLLSLGFRERGNSYLYEDLQGNFLRLEPLEMTYKSSDLLKKLTAMSKSFSSLSTDNKQKVLTLSKALL